MAAHPANAPARTPRRAERGFSLLEMIIALVVAAILLSIVGSKFWGAKKATYASEAKSAGSAYVQAISQFQADNANRNPTGLTEAGPIDLLGKPYMRNQPDGVRLGRIGFSPNCGAPSGDMLGWVAYCPGTEPAFGVRVQWRGTTSQPWDPGCWMGKTPQAPRC